MLIKIKTHQRGFLEAEKKLSEWQELSREEIDKISDELKANISVWGDASNQLNDSLKETFALDKAYLAGSIWNSLSIVADKTRVDFNEFTEDLFRHMSIDTSSHS